MNNLPRDRNWTLEEINDEHLNVVIPAVVLSVFAMTVGTLGNCLILYVFKFKYKSSNHCYFILTLAAFDLMFCLLGIPFMIVEMRLRYVIDNAACKVHRFLNHSFGFCSCFIIMAIAIERYLKICKPNRKQITDSMAIRLCYFSVIFGIVMALPSTFLYGRSSFQMGIQNLSKCYYQDSYKDTVFPFLYQAFLVIWFIMAAVTVCVSYSQIVCRIRTRNVTRNITSACASISKSLDSSEDISSTSNQPTLTNINLFDNIELKSTVKAHRLAKMLFIVAAVFIFSYIPYFGVTLALIINKKLLRTLSPTVTSVFDVFSKFFLINYFANPFVYGFMDRKFRAECKTLFFKMKNNMLRNNGRLFFISCDKVKVNEETE